MLLSNLEVTGMQGINAPLVVINHHAMWFWLSKGVLNQVVWSNFSCLRKL